MKKKEIIIYLHTQVKQLLRSRVNHLRNQIFPLPRHDDKYYCPGWPTLKLTSKIAQDGVRECDTRTSPHDTRHLLGLISISARVPWLLGGTHKPHALLKRGARFGPCLVIKVRMTACFGKLHTTLNAKESEASGRAIRSASPPLLVLVHPSPIFHLPSPFACRMMFMRASLPASKALIRSSAKVLLYLYFFSCCMSPSDSNVVAQCAIICHRGLQGRQIKNRVPQGKMQHQHTN